MSKQSDHVQETKFNENLLKLCTKYDISPSALAKEVGIPANTISYWRKHNVTPPIDRAALIANHFHVTLEKLLYGDVDKMDNLDLAMKYINIDPELTKYMQELAVRPELKMLFSVSRGATAEDIKQAVEIVEQVYKANRGNS